jgi:membrane-bound lytic murein transglycosylase B
MLPEQPLAETGFDQWIAAFRSQAIARGIADDTYTRVMEGLRPDTTGLDAIRNQPEFTQKLWQYINRVSTDWKIAAGQEKAKQYAPLLSRIEKDFGIEPAFMLGVWGIESAFGDPVVEKNHMRPVIPWLATLAWAEPRRRAYWASELINALIVVQRGWATPEQMIGSWAGAMGHTQWMPEVWLNLGIDYDGDGKILPYGPPDDALGTTARFFVERGGYRRGEHWGYEVRAAGAPSNGSRTYAVWEKLGVTRADGKPFPKPNVTAKLWTPAPGGPAFLLGQNFVAAKSYNPSMAYALGLVYLGDRCTSGEPFVQAFPDS